MAIHEVSENPDWADIRKFTTNILQKTDATYGSDPNVLNATYYSALSHVLVAQRIDKALSLVQHYMMDAAAHVGKVTENGNRLMVEASNRATEASETHTSWMVEASDRLVAASDRATASAAVQAVETEKQTRSLKHATWMLAVVTGILAFATVALAFYTRLLAMK